MRLSSALAVGVLALAPSANAAVLQYSFTGAVTTNTLMSGGFAGQPIGADVSLKITVDTSTTPVVSEPTRTVWDGVSGTILGLEVSVGSYSTTVTPDSTPHRARVLNDHINGSNWADQFWMECAPATATPDFVWAHVVLAAIMPPGTPVTSSLAGVDWPASNAELDVSTFTLQTEIVIRGTGPQILLATVTGASVVPTPAGAPLALVAGVGVAARRRRR